MIKPGLLMWIFRDDDVFYIRFLHFFGIGYEKIDDSIGKGYVLILGIWKFELGIHLSKRRGNYVERVKDQESTQASA